MAITIESGDFESETWDDAFVRLRLEYDLTKDAVELETMNNDGKLAKISMSLEEFLRCLPSALRKRLMDSTSVR